MNISTILKGYKELPFIKEIPNSIIAEFLDGFQSHEMVLPANEMRVEANVVSIKEELNSSHTNQVCEQLVAKNNRHVGGQRFC